MTRLDDDIVNILTLDPNEVTRLKDKIESLTYERDMERSGIQFLQGEISRLKSLKETLQSDNRRLYHEVNELQEALKMKTHLLKSDKFYAMLYIVIVALLSYTATIFTINGG